MYTKCISCPKIGSLCKGPRIDEMTPTELLAWCKARKQWLRWSNTKLAEMSGVPKGTIDRRFSEDDATDFKFETIRPIFRALVFGDLPRDKRIPQADDACVAVTDSELQKEVDTLRAELSQLRRENDHFIKENDHFLAEISDWKAHNAEKSRLLQERSRDVHRKSLAVIILSILLGICLAVIIAALIIDRLNHDIGFFWLDPSMFASPTAWEAVQYVFGTHI